MGGDEVRFAVLAALVLTMGCSDKAPHDTFTCVISTCMVIECDAYDFKVEDIASAENACAARGGTVNHGTCATAGSLGTCVIDTDGDVVTIQMFPSNTLVTPDDAKLSCETLRGTFTVLSDDLGIAPGTVSCTNDDECLEFYALTTPAQLSTAANLCETVGLLPPTAGGCSRTNVQAYCGADQTDVGPYRGIYYSDTGGNESQCTQQLGGEYLSASCS
jgi:putative hemolysin